MLSNVVPQISENVNTFEHGESSISKSKNLLKSFNDVAEDNDISASGDSKHKT